MSFFDEALKFKLAKHPITGAMQGAMLAGAISVYYDLATEVDSPRKSIVIVSTWMLCLAAGLVIGAAGYCHDYDQADAARRPN